jgi:competence protein ComGC
MNRKLIAVAAVAAAAATIAGMTAGCGDSATTTEAAQSAQPTAGVSMANRFGTALQSLVDDGTITASQKTAVVEALSSAGPQGGPGGQGDAQGGTPPGGARSASPPSDAQQGQPPEGMQGGAPDMSGMFGSALDDLVSAGTITSAQKAAILETLTSAMTQGGAGDATPTPGATSSSQSSV